VRPAYSVLYSFKGATGDGEDPRALINVKGTLYGTTGYGGAHGNNGTVFSITTSGTETVLYSFGTSSGDGESPQAGLLNVKGTLYGTTWFGGGTGCGGSGCGTVFAITTSGAETVLYSFGTSSGDGASPFARLTNVGGTLYGTTLSGGSKDEGTVFSITTSGMETRLHSFKGGSGDGKNPLAGLLDVNGTLYGTTAYGGGGPNCSSSGCGTVFAITTSGKERVLYSFVCGSGDGSVPLAGLTNVNGTLYGTTTEGGADNDGTVFSITPSGTETVLYSFKGGTGDGDYPDAGLLNVNGTLYSTTAYGGPKCGGRGCGTVFSITPSGSETVLHSFKNTKDGVHPATGLTNVNGTLYGTTTEGGANRDGTVFSLSP
jgi:uncharacterized repeat protein (TIGR03803 family)